MTKVAIVNLITRTPINGEVPQIASNRQTSIYHLARGLATTGLDVTLFVADLYQPHDIMEETTEPFQVVYVPTVAYVSPVFPITPSLPEMLHNKFDIVLSSEVTQPATFFAMISRLRSRAQKLVVWQEMAAHQSVVKKIPSRVLHATYVAHALSHAVDCFVPRSRSSAHFLRNYVPANKIAAPIIHGGDPTIFYPADTPPSFDWWFVYPARLVPNKNVERAIDTIAVLRKLGFPARLTVVGDGPLRENLQARISAFGLENAVILQTKRLDAAAMRALYISCSAMLVTTDRDLALLSVVEAVACACPVVVGTGADVAEDVEAADVGIAVRDHSTQGFVDALIRLGTDVSLRMRMRKRALEQHARFTDAAGEFVALFERENYLGPRP